LTNAGMLFTAAKVIMTGFHLITFRSGFERIENDFVMA
jgi:hypothetical protein